MIYIKNALQINKDTYIITAKLDEFSINDLDLPDYYSEFHRYSIPCEIIEPAIKHYNSDTYNWNEYVYTVDIEVFEYMTLYGACNKCAFYINSLDMCNLSTKGLTNHMYDSQCPFVIYTEAIDDY